MIYSKKSWLISTHKIDDDSFLGYIEVKLRQISVWSDASSYEPIINVSIFKTFNAI